MSAVQQLLYGKLAEQITEEGIRAWHSWGDQLELDDLAWNAILGEEVGEVASHVTKASVPPITHSDLTPDMLRSELIQVAAVALRWVYVLDNRP